MSRRKRVTHPMEQSNKVYKKRRRPRLKLEDAPPVHSIRDLIEIGTSIKFYKNLDTIMLWRLSPYLKLLDQMIGMQKLKETVFFQVIYYLQNMHVRNKNEEYLHTLILGGPGVGKTQVSKIIGKIYQAMGILSKNGPFKIAHRDDFIAEYLGQTAIKTKKLLNSCIGGVLFIDEVYSLAPTRSDRDSFSKEALDTLTAFLSEHKNDFCCIAAGYKEDVQNCFFAMNKGLERRFSWIHEIEDYSSMDLAHIFMKMVKEIKWDVSFEIKVVADIFEKNKKMFKHFGGDVETFISKAKMMHSRRVFALSNEHKFILTKEDLIASIEYIKKNNKPPVDNSLPFGMFI
jgi:stage V sporulation protein K